MRAFVSVIASVLCALAATAPPQYASVSLWVTDTMSGAPIGGVDVYCVEGDFWSVTDTDGHSVNLRVPYRPSGASERVGTVTFVLLKDGYVPCVCEVRTLPRLARSSVPLSLYPNDGSLTGATQIVEGLAQDVLDRIVSTAKQKRP